jgi:hypothetical protein
MGTYCGRAALQTFYDGVNALTGRKVPLVFVRGRGACTDGKAVYLPDGGIFAEADFQALCGLALHELAHIWFESNQFQRGLLDGYAAVDRPRAAVCFNAVIDAADEPRLAVAMPRAEVLFDRLRIACLDAMQREGAFPLKPPPQVASELTFLSAALLLARSRPHSEIRRRLRGWRSRPGVTQAFRILARAREHLARADFDPVRDEREWKRIRKLTAELFRLVERHFPRKPSQGSSPSPPEAADNDPFGVMTRAALRRIARDAEDAERQGISDTAKHWEDVQPKDPFDDQDACSEDEEEDEWDEEDSLEFEVDEIGPTRGPIDDGGDRVVFEEGLYRSVRPSFRACVKKLVVGATMTLEDGHRQGSKLGRLHRLLTDGRVFRRRVTIDTTEVAVSLLFDHSHSMEEDLGRSLAVGLALADALDEVPGVSVRVFRFGTEVERLERPDGLRDARLMGGTATHLALREAHRWLAVQEADRKLVFLFTDGVPDNAEATARESRELRKLGARLFVGSIGDGLTHAARTLPQAVVFNVDPRYVASSLHTATSRLVASFECAT